MNHRYVLTCVALFTIAFAAPLGASLVATPTVDHPPSQDRRQPRSIAPTFLVVLAAFPGGPKGILHHVFSLVPVADHAVGDAVQCRTVVAD